MAKKKTSRKKTARRTPKPPPPPEDPVEEEELVDEEAVEDEADDDESDEEPPEEEPVATVPPAKPVLPTVPRDEPAEDRDEDVGDGGTMADLKLAFKRNTGWIGAIGDGIGGLFHYFFVGCASLLGLAVVLLIPIAVAAAVAVLLGLPGYLAFRWFGTPEEGTLLRWYDVLSPLTVLVTIFWSGYFVTHGWPHLSEGLGRVFTWIKPALVWMGRILENITDDDED